MKPSNARREEAAVKRYSPALILSLIHIYGSHSTVYFVFSSLEQFEISRALIASCEDASHHADTVSYTHLLKQGHTLGIMGMTGSGKTTIVNLLERFYDVTNGSICLDEMCIRDRS